MRNRKSEISTPRRAGARSLPLGLQSAGSSPHFRSFCAHRTSGETRGRPSPSRRRLLVSPPSAAPYTGNISPMIADIGGPFGNCRPGVRSRAGNELRATATRCRTRAGISRTRPPNAPTASGRTRRYSCASSWWWPRSRRKIEALKTRRCAPPLVYSIPAPTRPSTSP